MLIRFRGAGRFLKQWVFIGKLISVITLSSGLGTACVYGDTLKLALTFPRDAANAVIARKLLDEVTKRAGIVIELKSVPAKRALLMANKGMIDGDASRIREMQFNPKYPNLRLVDAPFLDNQLHAYGKKDDLISIARWEDLIPHTIAYKRGIVILEKNIASRPFIEKNLHLVNTFEQGPQMVAVGRARFTVFWPTELPKQALVNLESNGIESKAPLYYGEGLIYLHKKNEKYIPIIAQALTEMDRDGLRRRIIEEVWQEYKILK